MFLGHGNIVEAMSCTPRAGPLADWCRYSPGRLNVATTLESEQFKDSGKQHASLCRQIRVFWMHSNHARSRQTFSIIRSITQNAQEPRASIRFQMPNAQPKPPKARKSFSRPGGFVESGMSCNQIQYLCLEQDPEVELDGDSLSLFVAHKKWLL